MNLKLVLTFLNIVFLGERRIEHPACANPECQVVLKNSPETYTYAASFPVCLQKTEGKIRIIEFIAYWEDANARRQCARVGGGACLCGGKRTAPETCEVRVLILDRIWEEKGCTDALRGGEMRFNLLGTRFDVMDLRARAEPWGDKGIQGNGWVLGVLVTWHWGSTALTRGDRVTAAVGLRRREMEGRAGGPLLAFPALKLTSFLAARRDCAGEIACNWMDVGGRCRIWSEACSLNTDANNSGSTLMSKLTPEVVARTRDEKE
ncbi:hypothetical protein C8F04DRAFT_1183508 [Mycena alexandri]|uniref:Uncharacterized protein n=1 Tax=Mycena alexandri TaxID=1745969 RepID=A0AAD6X2H8_9AGAR|nr:hypothetical protein C8F04DRAFT_1183508 [Mycena alexandri]